VLSLVTWKLSKAVSFYSTTFDQETRFNEQCGHVCAITYNSEEEQNFKGSFSEVYSSRRLAMKNSRKPRKPGRSPPYIFWLRRNFVITISLSLKIISCNNDSSNPLCQRCSNYGGNNSYTPLTQCIRLVRPLTDLRKGCFWRKFWQVEFYVSRNFPEFNARESKYFKCKIIFFHMVLSFYSK
jgi:hypothetical protein